MRPDLDLGPQFRKVDLSTLSSHPPIVGSPTAPSVWAGLWPNEAATQAFAEQLSAALQKWPGGRDARIELRGNLGAGKTTLVRHLLRAAGVTGRIKSPTYAVVEPHQAGSGDSAWPIWHFDFYRFNDPQEWEDAGFRELFGGPGLKLVEWPDKAVGLLPVADLQLHIDVMAQEGLNEDGAPARQVRWVAGTPAGQSVKETLHG